MQHRLTDFPLIKDFFRAAFIAMTQREVKEVLFTMLQTGESISPLQTQQQTTGGRVCAGAIPTIFNFQLSTE